MSDRKEVPVIRSEIQGVADGLKSIDEYLNEMSTWLLDVAIEMEMTSKQLEKSLSRGGKEKT